MRRTVGAILFVLGACAPVLERDVAIAPLEPGSFEPTASKFQGSSRDGTAPGEELERVRRIGSRIFKTAFELCAFSSDEANKPHIAASIPLHTGDVTDTAPQSDCRYALKIDPSLQTNALIQGNRISLTRGLIRFARQDAELAFALAHEVAHGLLRHGSAPFWKSRRSIELEADRLGLELLARAGYSVAPAVDLLRRMARTLPRSERPDQSYPSYSARADALQSTVREVKQFFEQQDVAYEQ